MKDPDLRQELLRMHALDERTMEELASTGSLYGGYHPRMEAVHSANAARLSEIIEEFGWPGRSLVGEGGMRAAWRIAQHAMSQSAFQRRALVLITAAAARGDAPEWQAAFLEDRIRVLEGRLQLYGTQFDWDENGEMSPSPIEEPEHVEDRRRKVGIATTVEEETRVRRRAVALSNEKPPSNFQDRQRAFEGWARSVGWRE